MSPSDSQFSTLNSPLVPPGYKQTEVGVLPEEWEAVTVGSLGSFTSGCGISVAALCPQSSDHPIPVFGGNGIAGYTKRALVCEPTVVVGRVGQRCGEVYLTDGPAWITDNALYPRAIRRELDVRFLGMSLAAAGLNDVKNRNDLPLVTQTILHAVRVPWPPDTVEQHAIATALSDVDGLLGGLDRLIAKKRDLKQAAMQQLLTGQTRLPGFGLTASFKEYSFGSIPDDWDVKPLKTVSTMNGRIGWQGLKQEEFTLSPNDPFLITGMNFKDGKIRWEEVYHIPAKRYLEAAPIQLQPHDVLMTKDGTIGKLLYVDYIPHPGRASLNSHLLVFRPIAGQYNPKFLFYQLSSPTFAQHVELHKSGTTFFGLSQTATGKYPTILPSVPEQTAIAAVLTDMDTELAALEQRREKTRALKQAMMQELLTGRIRLVESGKLKVESENSVKT